MIELGREVCGDLTAALRREWLVTNGLGGYASGTLAGIATRRYHGLLIAARTPPVGRTVLVGGLVEWALVDASRIALHAHEYADGTIDQHGYRRLESFRLDGGLPVWTFAVSDLLLEKRVWMRYGANTTYVRYAIVRGGRSVGIEVTPLVTERDHHRLAFAWDGVPSDGAVSIRADGGLWTPGGDWYRVFRHRAETARGLNDLSDLWAPGTMLGTVEPRRPFTLVLSTDPDASLDGETALAEARDRQSGLLRRAAAEHASPFVQGLVLAADQFLVERPIPTGDGGLEAGRSVIAGYPWFNDWGRDTMIALPGLTLATGRTKEARAILRAFGRFVRDGLLPNNFPDAGGEVAGYNSVDASLWYPVAIRAYLEATGERGLVDELLPVLGEILDRHVAGTRYGIAMDPSDGLLKAGEEGLQLTWMDAKVDDWVVTPRIGKPVEIQALWVNALRIVGGWLGPGGARFIEIADLASASFRARFWRPELGYCADVVDGPAGDETHLRPNQLFALSLPHPLLSGEEGRAVLDAVGRELLTSYGLRSLAPSDPDYRYRFEGDRYVRDGAYHQGTVWSWLVGPYAEALWRVTGDRAAALSVLRPMQQHLSDAGLGSISECFEPEPPHEPRACIAQAWGVAEVLRMWRLLTRE